MLGRLPVARARTSLVAAVVATALVTGLVPASPAAASTTPQVAVSPINAVAGRSFSGLVATITDPGGVDSASDYTVTVTWGDGTPNSTATTERVGNEIRATASHVYASPGSFATSVHVDHPLHQASASGTGTATVAAPLTLAMQPIAPRLGESPNMTLAILSDVDAGTRGDVVPTNALWIDQVYRDLLGREADEVGRANTLRRLDAGAPRTEVVNAMVTSREYFAKVTRDLYRTYLGRDVDAFSLPIWVEAFVGGLTMNEARANLLSSAEYFLNAGSTNGGFVDAIYRDLLGRAADAEGRAFHVRVLEAGLPRILLVAAFNLSAERRAFSVTNYYQSLLRRSPDAGGLAVMTRLLDDQRAREERIPAILAASDEYMARLVTRGDYSATIDWGDGTASTGDVVTRPGGGFSVIGRHEYARVGSFTVQVAVNDRDGSRATGARTTEVQVARSDAWISQLYLDLLGRPADAAGRARIQALLSGGTARDLIAMEILRSPEYAINRTAALFRLLLGREPDPLGHFVFSLVLHTRGEEAATALLVSSDEYVRRAGADTGAYVDALFRDLLGRAPDPMSRAVYVHVLNAGVSRETVVATIVFSPEARERAVDQTYQELLRRPADPLGRGLALGFITTRGSVAELRAILAGSDEYHQRL